MSEHEENRSHPSITLDKSHEEFPQVVIDKNTYLFDAASTETEDTDFIDFGDDDELLEQIMTNVHSLKMFYVQG